MLGKIKLGVCAFVVVCERLGVVANKQAGPINPGAISGPVSATLVFFY